MEKIRPRHASKQDVLERINILDVADLFNLRIEQRADGRYVMECPFHEERVGKPDRNLGNCIVRRDDGYRTCYCFACNGYGDVIAVARAQTGLSYSQAIDYLAEQLAPELLSGDSYDFEQKAKKRCPLTSDELKMIGLVSYANIIRPESVVFSKKDAEYVLSHEKLTGNTLDFDINNPESCPPTEYIACSHETYSISSLYQEDPELFFIMVNGKVQDKEEALLKTFKRVQEFPKGQLRLVLEMDIKKNIKKVDALKKKIENLAAA